MRTELAGRLPVLCRMNLYSDMQPVIYQTKDCGQRDQGARRAQYQHRPKAVGRPSCWPVAPALFAVVERRFGARLSILRSPEMKSPIVARTKNKVKIASHFVYSAMAVKGGFRLGFATGIPRNRILRLHRWALLFAAIGWFAIVSRHRCILWRQITVCHKEITLYGDNQNKCAEYSDIYSHLEHPLKTVPKLPNPT